MFSFHNEDATQNAKFTCHSEDLAVFGSFSSTSTPIAGLLVFQLNNTISNPPWFGNNKKHIYFSYSKTIYMWMKLMLKKN